MKKLKVLFISGWFPNRVTPNNGDFIQRHAQAVSQLCEVIFIHVQFDSKLACKREIIISKEPNFSQVLIYFNVRLKFLAVPLKFIKYFYYYIWCFKFVSKTITRPDLVHSNIIFPVGLVALLYKIFFEKKYVISEHWSIYLPTTNSTISMFRQQLEKLIVRNAEMVMPVTKNLKEALELHGLKGRYEIVPNVVDTVRFKLCDRNANKKSFIHISSLYNKPKNITGLIHAIKILSLKRQDFIFNIVGGDELEFHVQTAENTGINTNFIVFHGEKEHSVIPDFLAGNICLVLFSNYESFPCVLPEALSCGIPVISTDVGGIKEYISNKQGILIQPKDIQGLADAMDYMLDNFEKYKSDELREYAIANFSEKAIAVKFERIYQKVLARV